MEVSFQIIQQKQARVGRYAMKETQTVELTKELVHLATAERDLEESDERLDTPLGDVVSSTEYHRASQFWLIPAEDGQGYHCVCARRSHLQSRQQVFSPAKVRHTACITHGSNTTMTELVREERSLPVRRYHGDRPALPRHSRPSRRPTCMDRLILASRPSQHRALLPAKLYH